MLLELAPDPRQLAAHLRPPPEIQFQSVNLIAVRQADAGDLSVLVDYLVAMARKWIRVVLGPDAPTTCIARKEDSWRTVSETRRARLAEMRIRKTDP